MRIVPDELAARIESGAARLCICWIVSRPDGARMGFTDHDRDLMVGDVVCAAASGWTAGAAEGELGFAPASAGTRGVLDAEGITEADILRGRYDGAAVEAWCVDWSEPTLRVRLWSGAITRLIREGERFTAEIDGPLAALERVAGRTYGRLCDAELGDERCRANVAGPLFNGAGAATNVEDNRRLKVEGLSGFACGWFTGGVLVFDGGGLDGLSVRVEAHDSGALGDFLILRERPSPPVEPGAAFTVLAGCDRRWTTCRVKFANGANFRGFPHTPGDDFLLARATEGEVNDGGSRLGGGG